MNLVEFLEDVYVVNKSIAKSTQRSYRARFKAMQNWVGRSIDVSELNDVLLNRYLKWLEDNGRSSHTIHSARTSLNQRVNMEDRDVMSATEGLYFKTIKKA